MKRHDDNYSCIVFFGDDITPKKWKYVHKLNGFAVFITRKHSAWKYFNVYNRRTGEYLQRFYRDQHVPAFID